MENIPFLDVGLKNSVRAIVSNYFGKENLIT